MSITSEYRRIYQMMSGLTLSWPIERMDCKKLADIEAQSNAGDNFLGNVEREILKHLKSVQKPEDRSSIAQAYAAYAEATIYMLFKTQGIQLERTPGTGGHGEKRPDFLHKHQSGDVYFEVKCLDFQGGDLQHKNLANDALETAVDLDERARHPGVHTGVTVISPFKADATPADRIEILIQKIRGNAKMGQLSYGPCILIVDLGRLQPDADHPSCILPVYFNDGNPDDACVSGELWHVALGNIDDTIYRLPEFAGAGNIDRPLKEQGILYEYPHLLGISFVVPHSSKPTEVFSIWNVAPDLQSEGIHCALPEHEVGKLIHDYSSATNDNNNSYEYLHVRRP